MEKKLNPKSFWLILGGLLGAMVISTVNLIVGILTLDTIKENVRDELLKSLSGTDVSTIDTTVDLVIAVTLGLLILAFVIGALINIYFLLRLLKNKKGPAKQGYLTAMFILHIIGVILNIISVTQGQYLAIVAVLANVAVIVGRVMQNNYVPPREQEDDIAIDNPYSNNPYSN